MKIPSCCFATLWLIASAHVSAAQTPPSAPSPTPAPPHHEAAPAERRVEVRAKVAGPNVMHPMMSRPMMSMDAASMFLAHTGELQLTDAQVTRLAAIARRSEARERAMRARMDSAMAIKTERVTPAPDSRGGAMTLTTVMRMPMPTDAERKAQHEDNREAFAVPTPDQLATAWEMMMSHHGGRAMMMKMPR